MTRVIFIKMVLIIVTMLIGSGNMMITNAQDFKLTGQIRHRTEWNDKDFSDNTASFGFSLLRSRINLKFSKEKSYAFVQVQDSRVFGSEINTLSDGSADALDFHQAYYSVADIFTEGLSVKVGRFEVAYGNERIMGAVGWHNIARSFDGVTFSYKAEQYKADLFYLKEVELSAVDDIGDQDVRGVWVETSFAKPTRLDLYVINQRLAPGDVLDRNTIGVYSKGKYDIGSFSLSQEVDLAIQSGTNGGNSVNASLIGVRVKFAANETTYKFWGGIGYDQVSGDDSTTSDDEAFNTLYATNHKYYGYMDYFLNVPVHSRGAGLRDLILSAGFKPADKVSVKVDYHIMSSSQEVKGQSSFGTEIDVTATYGYRKDLRIVAGISTFSPGDLFKNWKGEDSSSWGYLMTIYNF